MSDLKTVEGRLEAASKRHEEIDRAIMARAQSGESLELDALQEEATEFMALEAEINDLTATKSMLTARLDSVRKRDAETSVVGAAGGGMSDRMRAMTSRFEGFQRGGQFIEGGPMRLEAATVAGTSGSDEGNISAFAPALDVADPYDWVAAYRSLPNVRQGILKGSGRVLLPGMWEAAFGPSENDRAVAERMARIQAAAATAGPAGAGTQGLQTEIPYMGLFPREPQIMSVVDIVPRVQINSLQFATSTQTRAQRPTAPALGNSSIAEGAAVPERMIRTSRQTHTIKRIGFYVGVTEDQLMLEQLFAQLMNVQIPQHMREEIEIQFLQGTNAAEQQNGIINQTTQTDSIAIATPQTGGFLAQDGVADAKATIRKANGLMATHVVTSPDVTAILLKSRTDAQPLIPMNAGTPMGPVLCGLPVMETQFLPTFQQNNPFAIVGAFSDSRACTFYTAGTPMIETTDSHGTLFVDYEIVARIRMLGLWVEHFVDAFVELIHA